MHELQIPMRWSDLDQLNHVNNVVYVDYAEQARAELVDAGDLPDVRVTRVDVEFRRPLLLSRTPVVVRTEVSGLNTTHEIAPDGSQEPFAVVRLEAEPPTVDRPTAGDAPSGADAETVTVRRGDLGADGLITATALFELSQEARILSFSTTLPSRRAGRFVVARVDMRVGEPIGWRTEPIDVTTAITRVGRSSFETTTWFEDGRLGRTTAVLVAFDLEAQRSRSLSDEEREALTRNL